jgi:hypothetical protein
MEEVVRMEQQLLLQFVSNDEPSINDVMKRFGLHCDEIDEVFGVIATDPPAGLYVVLIDTGAAARIRPAIEKLTDDDPRVGFFGDPPISTTDPT